MVINSNSVWRVCWYREKTLLECVYVFAPTKQFARWNARDVLMAKRKFFAAWRDGTRVTIGRMRDDTPRSLIANA